MVKGHGLTNPDSPKAIARHEVLCDLDDVLKAAKVMLHPGGKFFMVHRPFRLAEIFSCMSKHRIEPKRIQMVHPYVDKEPSMVLIEGARDGKPRLSVEPPLILYDKPGEYSTFMKEEYGF